MTSRPPGPWEIAAKEAITWRPVAISLTWPKLRRIFDYAEVELSNNLAENGRSL